MGFCIMFPHLCGLKTVKVSEMKNSVLLISANLEESLEKEKDMYRRVALIETAKAKAVVELEKEGFNIYEVV